MVGSINFPRHSQALRSARLAALHARLSLPGKFPLQTLARCLVDPSVDARPGYNNAPLATIGQDFLGYATSEYIICHYPRIPMPILFAAQYAYVGNATLASLRQEWGVDVVAAPGSEVDAGLLQLKRITPGNSLFDEKRLEDVRELEQSTKSRWLLPREVHAANRSISSRIVYDDQFGDLQNKLPDIASQNNSAAEGDDPAFALHKSSVVTGAGSETVTNASASFIRAVVGALYLHAGAKAAKDFHAAHILSRKIDLAKLFYFTNPCRDLSRLCAREDFEPPVARLLSETGRLSRHPVFVVGVYSGKDQLGEGAGASLNEARTRASAAALRSWYLYSPQSQDVVLPSEMEGANAGTKAWKPQMVDPGEIVT